MNLTSWLEVGGEVGRPQVLWEDGERVFVRAWRDHGNGTRQELMAVLPAADYPMPGSISRLTHEYGLRDYLDDAWAVRPVELVRERGRTVLLFEPPRGEPLNRLIGSPMEIGRFLQLAIAILSTLGRVHQRGLVHKDIKPVNILVDPAEDRIWLTGFGIASRLLRERQSPEPPELIAGTLAYMAPEQTGRMSRSINSRSDLYSLGIVLYQMITGSLPFTASDPMEWVHCHIARNPLPPRERMGDIPAQVSAIIMKLLAKTSEERYQTAAGAENDLRRCLAGWRSRGAADAFPLGEHDQPDRLVISEKLYGRAREIEALVSSFDEVVATGTPALVLMAGYSGIGKSSVVNELHRVLVPPRGLFAAGKFDQYKADIPYATFAQAFQGLIRPLLSKPQGELSRWRAALSEALSPNGSLMIDLVPELKLIIGEQPPVIDLPAQDAQRRFQLVLRRFVGVFARREHPLALFLDDLQWLDAATLDLLGDLLTAGDVRHLLLVGAYRDNEVGALHPLAKKLEAIRQTGAIVRTLTLPPLRQDDVEELLADALHATPGRVRPLAELVEAKTGGNPFFAIQFLSSLAEDGLLAFDHGAAQWSWDQERILARGYTDNVVDLMARKLARLPVATQETLQRLACLGNAAEVATLGMVCERPPEAVHADLWEALRQEMILRTETGYRFVHDRVQEAAYSLIPEESRPQLHLRIGRLLLRHTPADRRQEAVFEIVNQLNRSAALISATDEREELAELNLLAGKRSKASTAYASALEYLKAGAGLLTDDCWERRHDLIFQLELHRAECEFLTGELVAAEERLTFLSSRAVGFLDQSAVTCLRLDLYIVLEPARAVVVCLDYLRRLGIEWPRHPSEADARREYDRIWSLLGSRTIEDLVELSLMSDPASLATIDVLTRAAPSAYLTDQNLWSLIFCFMVNLSIEHGNSDGSSNAYVNVGMVAVHFGNYRDGYRFGRLGYDLVEKRSFTRYRVRTTMTFGNYITPWTRHVRAGRDLVYRAFQAAIEVGDITYAGYTCTHLLANLLVAGDHLEEVQREATDRLAFARRVRFGLVADQITAQLRLVLSLRGLTRKFGSFDSDGFDELLFERHLASNRGLVIAEWWYWLRKLQARFFAGDYVAAVDASRRIEGLGWGSTSFFKNADYRFYSALSHAACCDSQSEDRERQHFDALIAHHRQIETWAESCPENFETRAALVAAEIARIENRELEAERLYERAIRSANANGFVHNEALANELAARFYGARGFATIAQAYLRNARHCYLRWGADGKVRQLDQLYPQLREERLPSDATSTILAPIEQLDIATVIKVSQTVSGEIVLERLIETLIRLAIEHAGAARGLLILPRGEEHWIEAEAAAGSDAVTVGLRQTRVTGADLPESVFQYVLRTGESVLLHNASGDSRFASDGYIRKHRSRSVLCLPMIRQARLIGVVYLENNLSADVFTPARISVLKLLASEAAISLENSRLYRDLQEREARVRRLVDSNIIGIVIAGLDGRIIDANDAFLRMVGYGRDDLDGGRLRWSALTPAEWREADARRLARLKATGVAEPYEREFLRKDGTRVPVLVGSALFDGAQRERVAFVVDLSDRKRAEEAARDSEREARLVVDSIPGLVAVFSPTGELEFVNRQVLEFFGWTFEELMRSGTRDLTHPEDLPRVIELFNKSIESGKPFDFEVRSRRFDGVYRWLQTRGFPLRDANGRIVRWYNLLTDIDERKRAEDDLRRSQAFLAEGQRLSQTGSFTWRTDTDEILFSEQLYRTFEIDPTAILTIDLIVSRVHPLDLALVQQKIEDARRGSTDLDYEVRLQMPDGRVKHLQTFAHGVVHSDGRLEILGAMLDITQRRLSEETLDKVRSELALAARAMSLGVLTASIAHEVNQPLAGIITNANTCLRMLAADPPNVDGARDTARRAMRDGNRAAEVVARLRALFGKRRVVPETVDLNEVTREVIALSATELQRNHVVVHTDLADDVPAIEGDRVQVQQVILNLLLNASDALGAIDDRARQIIIKTDQDENGDARLTLKDTGIGIDPAVTNKLFDAFYTTKAGGMGIGLSVSRSIIEHHGGRIWAAPNDGPGATFSFSIPPRRERVGDDPSLGAVTTPTSGLRGALTDG